MGNGLFIVAAKRGKKLWCPYCKSTYMGKHCIDQLKCCNQKGEDATVKNYCGICRMICENCGNSYGISYGSSIFTTYNTPITVGKAEDIQILAEFKSKFFEDFTIECGKTYTLQPECDRYNYYIRFKSDNYPIFITEKLANEFAENPKNALNLIDSTYTARYKKALYL